MKSVDGVEMKDVPDGAYCRDLSTGEIYQKITFVDISTDEEKIVMIKVGVDKE